MSKTAIVSDQFNNRSDNHEESNDRLSPTQTQNTAEEAPPAGCHPSRLDHRTLQTLWKTRMQVCPRSGSRAQILSFGKQARGKTRDGLHPLGIPGTGCSVFVQSSSCAADSGRDLRDQPGAYTTQTEALGGAFGQAPARAEFSTGRSRPGGRPVGKHGGLYGRAGLCHPPCRGGKR